MTEIECVQLVKLYQDPDHFGDYSARYDFTMRFLEDRQNVIRLRRFIIVQFQEIIHAKKLHDKYHRIITSIQPSPIATVQVTYEDGFVWTTTPLDILCCHSFWEQLRQFEKEKKRQRQLTFLMGLYQGSLFRASKNWFFERHVLGLIFRF